MEAALVVSEEQAHLEWLEPVYKRHARGVIQTAYRVTGNSEDAEDVLQTVFMRLARKQEAPDFSGGAWPYLRRAATNAALDIVRSKSCKPSTPLEVVAPPEATGAGPEQQHHDREMKASVRLALTKVNSRNAQMFILRYFEDLDLKTIAEMFDTTPGTVAVTLHRVRSRIKDELRPFLGGMQ